MDAPTTGPGPAARAVLDDYHRSLAAHRRQVLIGRAVTAVLILWALAGAFVAPGVALATGRSPAWLGMGIPVGVLAIWFVVRSRVADGLGLRGEPAFPSQRLELAAQQDAATATPRAFGAVPESIRVYHPENW